MTWIQVLTIVLANISWCTTMFLWLRKESNADRKELSASISSNKKDFYELKERFSILELKLKIKEE